ncbi:MAG: hypothetical protein ONB24_06220 [candidate division KSB1 bacterium]|nr:hypothetical protein [candidate division KSB1 bacterium]
MMPNDLYDELFIVDFFDPFYEMRRAFAAVQQKLEVLSLEQNLGFDDIERILEREAPGLRRRLEELWRQLDGDICERRQSRKLSAAEVRRWREQLAAWQAAWQRAIEVCRSAVLEPAKEALCQVDYSEAA